MRGEAQDKALRCSFCNKTQREVSKLIAGPDVYICSECVDTCTDIVAEDRWPPNARELDNALSAKNCVAPVSCRLCSCEVRLESDIKIERRGWLCRSCVNEVLEAAQTLRGEE